MYTILCYEIYHVLFSLPINLSSSVCIDSRLFLLCEILTLLVHHVSSDR